jgi:FixJ family two-component response regulator
MRAASRSGIWHRLRIPDAGTLMLDQATTGCTTRPAKRPVVAVVDDDAAVCSSLQFSLELEGFAVRTYRSAADVLSADDLRHCNCFVIDQRMPGMTGIELIEALRRQNVSTPAILIISALNKALIRHAAAAAIPIVEKPLLGNALIERIREACGLA